MDRKSRSNGDIGYRKVNGRRCTIRSRIYRPGEASGEKDPSEKHIESDLPWFKFGSFIPLATGLLKKPSIWTKDPLSLPIFMPRRAGASRPELLYCVTICSSHGVSPKSDR